MEKDNKKKIEAPGIEEGVKKIVNFFEELLNSLEKKSKEEKNDKKK